METTQSISKAGKAVELFSAGCNCAQSVLCAYQEETGLPIETLKAVACCFGGGMRRGDTCGVVTGSLMALGLLSRQDTDTDADHKARCALLTQNYLKDFEKQQGHLNCRDLLGYDVLDPVQIAANVDKKKSTCPRLVKEAVLLLEEYFSELGRK